MSIGFLSMPYSDSDPKIIQQRIEIAERCQAYFLRQGIHLISPAIYGHYLYEKKVINNDINTWRDHYTQVAKACDFIYILLLDGWERSTGLFEESVLFPLEAHKLILPKTNYFMTSAYSDMIYEPRPLPYQDSSGEFTRDFMNDLAYIIKRRKELLLQKITSDTCHTTEELISAIFGHKK